MFQNEMKNYDIFVPTNYDDQTANKMMVALHPWNVTRWNSTSWCDTLIAFADANDLLLICPDGGSDGQISDPIDTAFTSLLIDSMQLWYNVNSANIFLMGFSWGGQVTYSYGLNNTEKFKGFMPIGAAINGTDEVNGTLQNATDKAFYIVHGSSDSPNARYYPILDSLNNRMACVNTNLLSGVGHTIDFPNRNQILSDAFVWLDTVSCGQSMVDTMQMYTTTNLLSYYEDQFTIYPLENQEGNVFKLNYAGIELQNAHFQLLDINGKQVAFILRNESVNSSLLEIGSSVKGIYVLRIHLKNRFFSKKIFLR